MIESMMVCDGILSSIMTWSDGVVEQFEIVDLYTTEESDFYGPFNSLLFELFPSSEHYQVSPPVQACRISPSSLSSIVIAFRSSSSKSRLSVRLKHSPPVTALTIKCVGGSVSLLPALSLHQPSTVSALLAAYNSAARSLDSPVIRSYSTIRLLRPDGCTIYSRKQAKRSFEKS